MYYSNGTSLDATNFKVKNISAPATTTDIVGLTPDTNYTFAISTTNRAAESPRSPEVIIATPGTYVSNNSILYYRQYLQVPMYIRKYCICYSMETLTMGKTEVHTYID